MGTATRLLLTVEEAARTLGIGRTMMYALIRGGEIQSIQIGRLRRIRPADLEAFTHQLAPAVTNDAA